MNKGRVDNRNKVIEDTRKKHTPEWKLAKIEKIKRRRAQEEKVKLALDTGEELEPEYLNDSLYKIEMEHEKDIKKEKNKSLDYHSLSFINPEVTDRAFESREKKIKVDIDSYEKKKGSGVTTNYDLNKVKYLKKCIEEDNLKKTKFHRKRIRGEDEEEIDYISEENRKFNQKLEIAFGKYTSEIKENFERGTAL